MMSPLAQKNNIFKNIYKCQKIVIQKCKAKFFENVEQQFPEIGNKNYINLENENPNRWWLNACSVYCISRLIEKA
jgi:hypothetical protein